ncbi:uncharacterized [Tachysurus ichikawai]
MATGQDSWLFGLGLVLSMACLVWNNESEDALCDRELMRKRDALSQLCGNKMAHHQTAVNFRVPQLKSSLVVHPYSILLNLHVA